MKNSFTNYLRCILAFLAAIYSAGSMAQLPTCAGTTGGLVYLLGSGNSIYNLDPTQPISATNPVLNTISAPSGANGLSAGPNLNGAGPSPTFYTVVGSNYYYYNGAGWTNTGHGTGNGAAVNIAGGGQYIYNLVGASGQVYRYDGTGTGTLILTITGYGGGGPYDLVCDCEGNFYVLLTSTNSVFTTPWLRKYSPTGALLNQWNIVGLTTLTTAGGGFAIVGSTLYYHNNTPAWVTGIINNATNTVTITNVGAGFSSTYSPSDVASCPLGGIGNVFASIDTGYYCGSGPGVPISAGGTAPFFWEVVSGPAVITGSGTNVTVTTTANARVRVYTTATNVCGGSNADTVDIIIPTAVVDAGGNDTLNGCGTYMKVLNGSLVGTQSFVPYNIAWTPAATVTAGATTLTPTVEPTADTWYYMTVSTPATHGGCTWVDSAQMVVRDKSVTANYSYNILYGCAEDTVVFTNSSTPTGINYQWIYGDNTPYGTVANPAHVYAQQGVYNVKLKVNNGFCTDSITQTIDLNHPLEARFTSDVDSVCQGESVTFTNSCITTVINNIQPSYFWDFADGGTSTQESPVYQFDIPGVYNVMMVVTDFVPCADTAWKTIVVDSIPQGNIYMTDSFLCEGQQIHFTSDYTRLGNTGMSWIFGDGYVITNRDEISHAYDEPGVYTVYLSATYRICNDLNLDKTIVVKAHPLVDIGEDTTICPNGAPIELRERYNSGNPTATYLWNTDETSSSIRVYNPGVYATTVTVDGCSTTDSLLVSKKCYIDIPNVFTPDNDGTNDYFLPRQLLSRGVSRFVMKVFNRWGQLVFETNSLDGRGWDGKFNGENQPTGVYLYMIEADFVNGTAEKYQGNISLIR